MCLSDHLSYKDLVHVRHALWPIRSKWYDIGLELYLDPSQLDNITATYGAESDQCVTNMLSLWLKESQDKVTWTNLVSALRMPTVACREIADKIEAQHCQECGESTGSLYVTPIEGNVAKVWEYRTGIGIDVHGFCPNRKLILGNIEIPHSRGLEGHSDADVLIHAIADAFLGAMGLGDIGTRFPDTDPSLKNMDSSLILADVVSNMTRLRFEPVNLDTVIVAQEPRIFPHISAIRQRLSELLHMDQTRIGIKATTTEKMGFIGRREGIAVHAVCSLRQLTQLQ